MKTFAERKAALERLGWKFHVETEYRGEVPRQPHDIELFKSVRLPLTPRDWCRLCMREGEDYLSIQTSDGERYENSEYVGGCCGNMSAVQDTLNEWFRDGGWVDVDKFVELGEAMRDHGDEEFNDLSAEQLAERVDACVKLQENPPTAVYTTAWGKLALLYQLVKDHYVPELPKAPASHTDEVKSAFHLVSRMAWAFGLADMFSQGTIATQTTESAQKLMRFYRFLPALKIVAERSEQVAPEPLEGWAIVDLSKGEGEVAENRVGLCVYATKLEAQRVLDLFEEADKQYEEGERRPLRKRSYKLRPVRVSWQNGLEFLDDGAEPQARIPWKRKPSWLEDEVEDVEMLFDQYAKTRYQMDKDENRTLRQEALMAWCEAAEFFGYDR
jgi:hypothetical protein